MICIHFRASPLFFALLEVIFFYLITELAGEEVQEMEVNLMQTMQERGECQQKKVSTFTNLCKNISFI